MTLDQALGNCERESIIDDSVDGDTAVAVGHQDPELRLDVCGVINHTLVATSVSGVSAAVRRHLTCTGTYFLGKNGSLIAVLIGIFSS